MYINKISDKQIRQMMESHPDLFPGMIATHVNSIDRIRQEMALYEHQNQVVDTEGLLISYLGFREHCESIPEF
ncbi:hypothetical protein RCJ22_07320 [Vibrio sp. FNV 38]|nr:hypothetical protein [Vibrio sp. FNV 38]